MTQHEFVTIFGGGDKGLGQSFCDEYQVVYDSFTTKPSSSVAAAQNTMVESLVNDGLWAKLDVFYLLAQESNGDGEALKNWILPGTNDATLVNAPAFVSLEGFTGDGSTSYINTNYNPDSDATNYVLDSASIGVYSRTDVDENSLAIGVQDAANKLSYMQLRNSNACLTRINATSGGTVVNADSSGMFVGNRVNSTTQTTYRNSSTLGDITRSSDTIPDADFFLSALNINGSPGSFSTQQLSIAYCGAGLTPTNITDLTNTVEVYMDSNSKGVIS